MLNIVGIIKARKQAAQDCIASDIIPCQQKQILQQNVNFLNSAYYGGKALVIGGIVALVDWKKKVPFVRRQLPLALLGVGSFALIDYMASQYAFKKNEDILVKYTGFKDGIYMKPKKFNEMKKSFNADKLRNYEDDEDLINDA